MKIIILLVLVLFLFSGCEESKNPVSQYGDKMVDSYKRAQQVSETVNLDSLRKAVQAYHAANEKFPSSLDDIKDLVDTGKIDLSRYDYNPQTGVLSNKK